jgi:hypothetical protein
MAKVLCDVYESFDQPLTDEMLWQWHERLFRDQPHIVDCGKYRTHVEHMQIVSYRYDSAKGLVNNKVNDFTCAKSTESVL